MGLALVFAQVIAFHKILLHKAKGPWLKIKLSIPIKTNLIYIYIHYSQTHTHFKEYVSLFISSQEKMELCRHKKGERKVKLDCK